MITQKAFVALKQRACELLVSRDFEPILPVEDCYIPTTSRFTLSGQRATTKCCA